LVSGNTLVDCTQSLYYTAINLADNANNCIVSSNSVSSCDIPISIQYANVHGGTYCHDNYVYGNTYNGNAIGQGSPYIKDYGTNTIYTQPPYTVATVASSPTGVGYTTVDGSYGYAGSYSTSPYSFYKTVGASATIAAASSVGSYSFSSWSDSGSQSHSITVPSTYTVYTATYSSGGVTPSPSPSPSPTPTVGNSVNFAFKDSSGGTVSSGVTWQLYNGATPVSYTMGAYTLGNIVYTLKTYYAGYLVNTTTFYAPTYNGLTFTVNFALKQGSYFNIASNNPLTSLVINSENSTSLSFTATGSSGPYTIVIPTDNNALFLNLNGVAQAYGSGWSYDSVNHCVVITAASLPAS
jgi:hypothetical protein